MGERENLTVPSMHLFCVPQSYLILYFCYVNMLMTMLITRLHRFFVNIHLRSCAIYVTCSYTIRDMAPKYIKYAIRYNKTGY